jgi:hypothetical protein
VDSGNALDGNESIRAAALQLAQVLTHSGVTDCQVSINLDTASPESSTVTVLQKEPELSEDTSPQHNGLLGVFAVFSVTDEDR